MLKRAALALTTALTAVVATVTLGSTTANAAPCADVEVVFARGTAEVPAPLGIVGTSFTEALRSQLPGKSVAVHAVNYPASSNFDNRLAILESVTTGIRDAQRRVTYLASNCPNTKIVLGGYSQGGAVAGYTITPGFAIPPQYQRWAAQAPKVLPENVRSHIKAVVLFAPPSARWLRDIGAPPMTITPQFRGVTKTYCIPGDVVCDGAPVGQPNGLHVLYSVNGMTLDAAGFVKARL